MALPPQTIGDRTHAVVVGRREDRRWSLVIDGRALAPMFPSELAARAAAATETQRLDAVAYGLLRRVRRGLRRKQ